MTHAGIFSVSAPRISLPVCVVNTLYWQVDEVIAAAKRAKKAGSTRFCMGAAWRELGNKKKAFNNILDMVIAVLVELLSSCVIKWPVSCLGGFTFNLACDPNVRGYTRKKWSLAASRWFQLGESVGTFAFLATASKLYRAMFYQEKYTATLAACNYRKPSVSPVL